MRAPPRGDQPVPDEPVMRCHHSAPSMPRVNTWKSAPSTVATGAVVRVPPPKRQSDHPVLKRRVHNALSIPRTNTLISVPLVTAVGSVVIVPPRDCQPDHEPPMNRWYHNALSMPRTNTN